MDNQLASLFTSIRNLKSYPDVNTDTLVNNDIEENNRNVARSLNDDIILKDQIRNNMNNLSIDEINSNLRHFKTHLSYINNTRKRLTSIQNDLKEILNNYSNQNRATFSSGSFDTNADDTFTADTTDITNTSHTHTVDSSNTAPTAATTNTTIPPPPSTFIETATATSVSSNGIQVKPYTYDSQDRNKDKDEDGDQIMGDADDLIPTSSPPPPPPPPPPPYSPVHSPTFQSNDISKTDQPIETGVEITINENNDNNKMDINPLAELGTKEEKAAKLSSNNAKDITSTSTNSLVDNNPNPHKKDRKVNSDKVEDTKVKQSIKVRYDKITMESTVNDIQEDIPPPPSPPPPPLTEPPETLPQPQSVDDNLLSSPLVRTGKTAGKTTPPGFGSDNIKDDQSLITPNNGIIMNPDLPSKPIGKQYWLSKYSIECSIQLGCEVAYKPKKSIDGEWFHCEVVKVSSDGIRFEVRDPEPDEFGKQGKIFKCNWKDIILIPPKNLIKKNQLINYPNGLKVLARYPETTTFYPAVVISNKRDGTCRLKFDGEEEADKQTEVPRRFVLPFPTVSAFPTKKH
ncbi:hypothetical protein TBLA_0D04840 [Henningerozyma blattae CBS 6284]|uniref:SGF29 C-terminal domain-containing protein n=1 Tax=Henningerozyma blattae (strain ATCC 34711 / CBS 6284 / DSM 70876 / NBRC 10599 / NRRL Y-10934 / UCD 77-7) TaxID=1071380 RepID=I2H3M8_HENB6|nr:hypothetical protein TBLA_0D04840 [Tetrapisispora blattae CBS 6284]CCH60980.1 hypothetical protein TBLA_0D04840 [Tetrapisispora blattae CBS 6284]